MISKQFEKYWHMISNNQKYSLIKDKGIEMNNLHKRLLKATEKELAYPPNRIGRRGGKFTSLVKNSTQASKSFYDSLEELQYMTKTL